MSGDNEQTWSIARELGAELRSARYRAGKTKGDVTQAKLGSRQKIWRIEAGHGPFKFLEVQALCELYGVPAQHASLLVEMAKATDEPGNVWLESSPKRFGLYLLMEKRATHLTAVEGDVVHGLLQVPAYHEALQKTAPPLRAGVAAAHLKLRQERQAAFWARDEVSLDVVMSEAALRRVVGSRDVMAEQLVRLGQLAGRPGVCLRYIPLDNAGAPSIPGAFTIIRTDLGESAYVEHIDGGRILSDRDTVAAFRDVGTLAFKASRDIREWQ